MVTLHVIESLDALPTWVGREVARSDWIAITQERIQRFAEVTGDLQWIHTDPERARRESPFKSTVAHGYLTLALLPMMFQSCLRIGSINMAINYGLDRVRFPAPVLAGQRVRGRLMLDRVEPIDSSLQAHWSATVEIEGGQKPGCVAQLLTRYYRSTDTRQL